MNNIKLHKVPEVSSIQDMLVQSARRFGEKLALEDLAPTPIPKVSYNQLLQYVSSFGCALKNMGIKERAHIAVISENRVQWGITYLTAMCFNYVIVPIDKNLNVNEVMNIIHESDAEVIVFSESFDSMLRERHDVLKKLKTFINMDLPSDKDGFKSMINLLSNTEPCSQEQLPKINPEDLAEIIFTSGSLGRAKGVMLSQKNLAANLMSMVSMMFIYPEDRFLSVLPIHHTYECTCGFLCPLYSGASAHYARSLKTVVEDLQKVKATMLLAVPLLYDKMFKRIHKSIQEDKIKSKIVPPMIKVTGLFERVGWKGLKKKVFKELHERFGGHIRVFIAGGAAPDPKVAKGLREFGFTFIQGYGLTETAPILALNQLDNFKDDAAGIPLPKVELKINKPDSEGVGEVYAKGPNVMIGYYKNEKLTSDAFDEGWFKTGDLGYIDKDGFLHISGRQKNVIIAKNGKNVFPEEIEDILNRSPYILESLVYGEKDPKQDEIIAVQLVIDAEAFIEYSEKNKVKITDELIKKTIDTVIKESNKELSSHKQIKKYYIRESEFEKTTTQKIKRYLIKKDREIVSD
ncbi:MAG: AMP-dependent synthetase [Ignavibacteria bacterium CG2_30_36_16]|nr:AMP-binding protein [Ignavibacteria bacterium]OIP62134.1 MAG: AMP-dependent synthetase [Ignavibacteria bacterium CG2_30_36_16]PJA99420.1 MAG: long-chain fatty acid--CoA ligase [Ignavibacteria bacterium CG_4_9_14_3_um_filter_36_18]